MPTSDGPTATILLNIIKILVLCAVGIFLYITLDMNKPFIKEVQVMTSKTRTMSPEQIRMHSLNEIFQQNSDILPNRTTNLSAKELCNKRSTCAPKGRRYETMLRVAPKYKLLSCVIQKSMSTMMSGTTCYLYDEEEYRKDERSIEDEFHERFCKDKNEFSSVEDARDAYNISFINNDWSFSMVTRHPIDRFISGYVDRCIRIDQKNITGQCNGCGLNITCFIQKEYKRVMDIANQRKTRRTMEDAHFFPQIWHCDLDKEVDYFEYIQYSSDPEERLIPQLEEILVRQNVPSESIDFIKSELTNKRSSHSTVGTNARNFYYDRLINSPFLLEYIVKMFYYDFLQFHYELPEGF